VLSNRYYKGAYSSPLQIGAYMFHLVILIEALLEAASFCLLAIISSDYIQSNRIIEPNHSICIV
jgi:hypothetical protein